MMKLMSQTQVSKSEIHIFNLLKSVHVNDFPDFCISTERRNLSLQHLKYLK